MVNALAIPTNKAASLLQVLRSRQREVVVPRARVREVSTLYSHLIRRREREAFPRWDLWAKSGFRTFLIRGFLHFTASPSVLGKASSRLDRARVNLT